MDNPYFSIIIPVHNAEHRIVSALLSICNQTDHDYELICVCDSCTDNSADICRQFGADVYEVNYGNDGLSRNKGLDVATGDWVLFMDDDDMWAHPFVLEGLKKQLHDDVDIIQCAWYWRHIGYQNAINPDGSLCSNVWSKCWNRKFIGETRFPNVHSVSDYEFTKLMFAKNPRIAIWDCCIYDYNYMRPGSITEIDKREENKLNEN